MHYSNIHSRAGLVALVFALIISLVSAVPIPATESGPSATLPPRSNPSLGGQPGQDHIRFDNAKISLSGRMSTLPAATRALTRGQHISSDMDDQLVVRRNFFSGIKHTFQKVGGAIKKGVQKVGGAIKKGVQKVGGAIKKGVQKVGGAIKKGVQKVGGAIKKGVQKAGNAIKHGLHKVGGTIKIAGNAIKHGFQKVGGSVKKVVHAIKGVAQKVGHAIKTAARNVQHFIKTDGPQDAKFGLKVVQTVGAAGGKVAAFVPGVGLPVDLAIEGVSTVAGQVSDNINVKLPSKMQTGMDVMNKANQFMDYIPRRREFSEEEDFQQRDTSEAYHFEEHDDFALESREESYFEVNERDI